MRDLFKMVLATVVALGIASSLKVGTAQAGEYDEVAQIVVNEKIKPWLNNPAVIAAVKAQNEANAGLTQADIDALDLKWRSGDEALISGVLNNELSVYLQGIRDQGEGLYTEIFVMDNKGLNVGQSDKTSDYWQGDEAKWTEVYPAGADVIHLSDVEEDESSQTFQMQISLPIVDGSEVIGAVTVGVNADML